MTQIILIKQNQNIFNMQKLIFICLILSSVLGSCAKDTFPVEYGKLLHDYSKDHIYILGTTPRIMLEDGLYIVNYMDIKLSEGESWTSKNIARFMAASSQFTEGTKAWFDMKIKSTDYRISTDRWSIFKNINNDGRQCGLLLLNNPRTGDGSQLVNLYVSNYIAVKEFKPSEIVFYVNGKLLTEEDVPAYKKLRKRDLRKIKISHDPQTCRVDVLVTTAAQEP